MTVSIYIYNLIELNKMNSYYQEVPPEMNLFSLFYNQIINNYNIVNDISIADIAFIPIDYTKILYRFPDNYKNLPLDFPPTPPTLFTKYKQNNIKYFWNNYVDKYLIKTSQIPHFILYSYVLFEIDFSYIPESIIIISYENKINLYNIKNPVKNSNNKILIIPYILNENKQYSQSKITNYFLNDDNMNNLIKYKQINLAFFGETNNKINRPILTYYRNIIKIINKNNFNNYIIDKGIFAEKNLPYIKYLFVLRGDTQSRLCFYQCFAFGVIPILYQDDFELYNNLILSVNLLDSVFIIPNYTEDLTEKIYNNNIINMLKNELSNNNNYINKVKNHKKIFNELNYFTEPLCKPIENIINKIKNN